MISLFNEKYLIKILDNFKANVRKILWLLVFLQRMDNFKNIYKKSGELKQMISLFNEEICNKILDEFKVNVENNLEMLENEIEEGYNKSEELKDIKNVFNSEIYTNRKMYPKYTNKYIIDGLGNIITFFDGKPSTLINIIILAIKTHNQFYLNHGRYKNVDNKIIEIFDKALRDNSYSTQIVQEIYFPMEKLKKVQDEFDGILLIGTKRDYNEMAKNFNIPIIFYDHSEINVIVEENLENSQKDKKIKAILKRMDEYAFKNDITINYYPISFEQKNSDFSQMEIQDRPLTDKNNIKLKVNESKLSTDDDNKLAMDELNKIIREINTYGTNQIVSIFSNNTSRIYYCINQLHSNKIFVNRNPFEFEQLSFEETEFVRKKYIILP